MPHITSLSTKIKVIPPNLRLYASYMFLSGIILDHAIFMLYMQHRGLDVQQAVMCEATYQLSTLLFEIPTGWISDKFGRKTSLLTASCLLAIYNLGMIFAHEFWHFAILMALCSMGYTCISGSDTSLLYELLQTQGKANKYLSYNSKILAVQLVVLGGSIFLGSMLSTISWTALYILMIGMQVILFTLLLFIHETHGNEVAPKVRTVEINETQSVRSATSPTSTPLHCPTLFSWTTHKYPIIFTGFLAIMAILDIFSLTYEHSIQVVFGGIGVPITIIGLFAGATRIIKSSSFITANALSNAFTRTRTLIVACISLAVAFAALPFTVHHHIALFAVSFAALFIYDGIYIIVESITQDFIKNSSRVRVLSSVSMVRGLFGFMIYTMIGASLKYLDVQITLAIWAVCVGVTVCTIVAGYAYVRKLIRE